MSMLAERKRKQKWSLNPRGKFWTEDNNKFGQKMLEKMGWSSGKGLGANENGITEAIKVAYKMDNKGVGFKDRDDQWTELETNFGTLLETLSGDSSETLNKMPEIKSLEEKSQNSRVRVHYRKFTRGKDLSRYSEKDLANIFGKKTLTDSGSIEVTEEEDNDDKNSYQSNSPFLINGGSMIDYFKKRLPNFGKTNNDDSPQINNRDSESESECRAGFGFKVNNKSKETFVSYVAEKSVDESMNLKRKCSTDELSEQPDSKKKKIKVSLDETSTELKKSKKKNKLDNKCETVGLSNPAFDPLHSNVVIQKHQLNTISENIEEEDNDCIANDNVQTEIAENVKSNKSKKKTIAADSNDSDSLNISENITEEKTAKKKKKKSKDESSSSNMFSNTINDEEICSNENASSETIGLTNILNGDNYEVKRKVKKSKRNIAANEEISCSFEQKKKKKKQEKSENITVGGIENPALHNVFDDAVCEESVSPVNAFEVKRKKKKKSVQSADSFALKNDGFNNTDLDNSEITNNTITNEYEVKRKVKKSKKPKKDRSANEEDLFVSENLALDLNDSQSSGKSTETCSSEFEVKRKTKKNKKPNKNTEENLGLDNPCLNTDNLSKCESNNESVSSEYEVVRKSKKHKKSCVNTEGINNEALNLNDSNTESVNPDISAIESDLMFNIVSTPIIKKNTESNSSSITIQAVNSSVKRRKSVRFNDVTQEHIIPNKEDAEQMELRNEMYSINSQMILNSLKDKKIRNKMSSTSETSSIDHINDKTQYRNVNFNKRIDSISQKIDGCQAEVENDINEAKLKTVQMEDMMIGQVGNPDGENASHEEGSLLKFKHAKFGGVPAYMRKLTGPKKSYKHLIKGDIVVKFPCSNLHEINGYASEQVTK